MKNALIIIVLFLLRPSGPLCAQIVYFDTTGVRALQKTTTIFVVPEADSVLKAGYEYAISSSWKITPYKIVSAEELGQYAGKGGYSFFCEICFGKQQIDDVFGSGAPPVNYSVPYSGIKTIVSKRGYSWRSKESKALDFPDARGDYCYYSLFMKGPSDIDNNSVPRFADIKIGIPKGHEKYVPAYKGHATTDRHDPYEHPYWTPGLLKMYLRIVNNELTAAASVPGHMAFLPFLNSEDTAALSSLVHDTLYIPDYIESSIAPPASLSAKLHRDITDADITKDYPYPYRLVTSAQLSDLILNSGHNIYFLAYSPYYPPLVRYDGEKWSKESHGTLAVTRSEPHPSYLARKGIKVYSTEKGIIYANYPVHNGVGNVMGLTSFADDDLEEISHAIMQTHQER